MQPLMGSTLGNCEITNIYNGVNNTTTLKTYSTGSRRLFTAIESGRFVCYIIPNRFEIDHKGTFTLITNTSMAYMADGCNGRYIMFKSRGTDDSHWKFGIVASMHYLDSLQSAYDLRVSSNSFGEVALTIPTKCP